MGKSRITAMEWDWKTLADPPLAYTPAVSRACIGGPLWCTVVEYPIIVAGQSVIEAIAVGLPIAEVLPDVLEGLNRCSGLVLEAPPGAGKTTVVPIAVLLQEPKWLLHTSRILVLEPRRLAAKAAARRMAALLGEQVGQRVGYRVRLEARISAATRVEVVTTGILLRRLQQDPELHEVGAVIFDEFHERGVDSDLALALCLDCQRLGRPDLRLAVMSATLGGGLAEQVASLLATDPEQASGGSPSGTGNHAAQRERSVPVIVSAGRSYPVRTHYLGAPGMARGALEQAAADAVVQALQQEAGDVLCFLPGAGEIRRVQQLLSGSRLGADVCIRPLYGNLPPQQQDEALRADAQGRRRVVLSTPIAESSLTIDGVRVVVDSGYARSPRFETRTGMDRLHLVRISKASADQRRGRAGRTAPGVCYRLWSERQHAALEDATRPEIASGDLCPLALQLALWGCPDGAGLPWLDPPPQHTLEAARALLQSLGALDAKGSTTVEGQRMAGLGVHPRLAHMALKAAALGCPMLGCMLAALISERDVLRGRSVGADIRIRLDAIAAGVSNSTEDLDRGAAYRVLQTARQLSSQLRSASDPDDSPSSAAGAGDESDPSMAAGSDSDEDDFGSDAAQSMRSTDAGSLWEDDAKVGMLVAAAYPDRIAQRRDRANRSRSGFLLASGRGARLPGLDDRLHREDYLAVAHLGGDLADGRNDNIFLAAPVTVEAIQQYLPEAVTTLRIVDWAAASKMVVGRRQTRIGQLVVAEAPLELSDEEALPALLKGIRSMGLAGLGLSKSATAWLSKSHAEKLPDLSEEALMADLESWLGPYLAGVRSKADLQRRDIDSILRSRLTWAQQQMVEAEVPSRWQVPSGSHLAIDYSQDPPLLRVRLQEMFGAVETPRIAGGRVPLTLQLLSPAQRPVQVTQDLAGFWATGYPQVKKELKGRYPKHFWPDNPLQAQPTQRVRPPAPAAAKGTPANDLV
ncbi:hypothetical protein WJX72_000985 [[Myrmecia] bisecta]|uniref:ATP-dependent helicase HrpB n=1 Tax=[Myrmecia] bisecta TaxID=41462 RepID=A0AAW1PSQ2_9CHLO